MTFIPGMAGVADSAGVILPPLEGIEVSITTADNTNIAWPAGVAKGDVYVLFDNAMNLQGSLNLPTKVVPTGFTELVDEDDFYQPSGFNTILAQRLVVSKKLAVGDESGNITGMTASASVEARHKVLLRIRGTNRPIVQDYTMTWFHDWGTAIATQTLNLSLGFAPKIALGTVTGMNNNFSTSPNFAVTNLLSEELVPTGDFRTRVGHTVYNPLNELVDHNINDTGRGIVASGVMWFR